MATDSGFGLAFARRGERVIAGVAGGFAGQHGVDPLVVRLALVVLTFTGGIGVVIYAVGAVVARPSGVALPQPAPRDLRRDAAVGCVTLGLALLARSAGLWLGDAVMAPMLVIGVGVGVLVALRPDAVSLGSHPGGDPMLVVRSGRHARARVLVGAGLVAAGVALVGVGRAAPTGVRIGAFATSLTIVGIAVVLGPWLIGLAQAAAEERRVRIRADERDAMAAHLHDSVLQTLALIQRTADDQRRVVALARRQERELRDWLYGSPTATAGGVTTIGSAVRDMIAEIETTYGLRVELVIVGDRDHDAHSEALVAAVREAVVNAAKHSGVDLVSVYVEVHEDAVEAFVRDRGVGFDSGVVGADRRGIADSILARVERVGGRASIESTPDSGTEVQLEVPIAAAVTAATDLGERV